MSNNGKYRCSKFYFDKHDGTPSCRSTHVCYKSVCYKTMFEEVNYKNGHLILTSNDKELWQKN